MKRRRNVEWYWTRSTGDTIDLVGTPWVDDVTAQVNRVVADPQLRILVGPRVLELLERANKAPRRQGPMFTKVSRADIQPEPYEGASEGWFRDALTGNEVVQEDDGTWYRVTPPPAGAFTVGELVRLDCELKAAHGRLADAAAAGVLTRKQRELAGPDLGDVTEDVEMRVGLQKMQLTPEEEQEFKRKVLTTLAERHANPAFKRLKRRVMR